MLDALFIISIEFSIKCKTPIILSNCDWACENISLRKRENFSEFYENSVKNEFINIYLKNGSDIS
jgi:hypothetical protein